MMHPAPRLVSAGLMLCAWGTASAVPSAASVRATSTPTATPVPLNDCRSLPIQDLAKTHPELASLETVLAEFEASFENRDARRFRYLVHPALKLDASKRDPVFEDTFLVYGLDKPKLTRSSLFELSIANNDNPVADCLMGTVRGVVGPQKQYAAFHTVLSASEQIRFLTIFSPIPKSLDVPGKTKFKMGIVMFHTQVWTHNKKTAEKYLEEARRWSQLGEPMTAWVLAEGALRLLDSNPYFTPRETQGARNDVSEYFGRMPSRQALTEEFRKRETEWDFDGYSVVFQASGMEPAARFRLRKEESVEKLEKKCRKYVALAFGDVKGLREAFRGVECIPYSPGEDGTRAPLAGTVFVKWSDFPKP